MKPGPLIPGSRRTTVTVGTFDGVHRGHQEVVAEIALRARATERASVLVTFEPHPLKIVAPDHAPKRLTTADEKRLLWPLFELDYVLVLPFTNELRQLGPEEFVQTILIERLCVGELVIGYDHGFGKDRKGDVETLRRLGAKLGFSVDVVGPVAVGPATVSSSRIREAIGAADFGAAARGLGRPYSALGKVVRGAGRGRGLGFPTANLQVDAEKCLPPAGVYAVRVDVDGTARAGMANLGPRPTFGESEPGLEVHLLDWAGGSLEGARPAVEFVARLRPVRRFDGPASLVAQLGRDREAARSALASGPEGRVPAGRGGLMSLNRLSLTFPSSSLVHTPQGIPFP